MKEKLLALLLAKFVGVRNDGLAQLANSLTLQVENETEATALVEKLTADRVNEYVRSWRAQVDREVTEAAKTVEANLKTKFDLVDKVKPDPSKEPKPNTPTDEMPAWAKILIEGQNAVTQELGAFKADTITKTRHQTLSEKLATCKDETFKTRILKDFSRMKPMSDEEFAEYLTETEGDIGTANQNATNVSLGNARPWQSSGPIGGKEATKEELDAVLDKIPL